MTQSARLLGPTSTTDNSVARVQVLVGNIKGEESIKITTISRIGNITPAFIGESTPMGLCWEAHCDGREQRHHGC